MNIYKKKTPTLDFEYLNNNYVRTIKSEYTDDFNQIINAPQSIYYFKVNHNPNDRHLLKEALHKNHQPPINNHLIVLEPVLIPFCNHVTVSLNTIMLLTIGLWLAFIIAVLMADLRNKKT
jgi:hypothetical protein